MFSEIHYVPGTMQDAGSILLNRKDMVLALMELIIK